jgi:Fe2+ or Zn2+ uptake regulation protein
MIIFDTMRTMKMRNSKKRDQILTMLKQEHGAISAAELHQKLPDMNLTTIYRNLETFVKAGKVQKLQLNGIEAQYEYASEPHHHAVCADCDKVIHFTAPNEKIKELLGLKDFEVQELEVTVRGVCKSEKKK